MKIAIMQPYFLPYIGYFQLMKAADLFVYYDDVSFIKQSWINRNRIILNGREYLFTLELQGASSFRNIDTVSVGRNRTRLLKTFSQAYREAPYYHDVEPILNLIMSSAEKSLTNFIIETHHCILNYLGVEVKSLKSSSLEKDYSLKGKDKVIEICKRMGAVEYINSPGGKTLYSKQDFADNGITLTFLQPMETRYKQFDIDFIPWLSIVDVLAFNPVTEVRLMLDNYRLI